MDLILPFFLNTVVALGSESDDGTIEYHATGFFYGYPTSTVDLHGGETYWLFLVTNRHVIEKGFERKPVMQARLNKPFGSGTTVYPLYLKRSDGSPAWVNHPQADVAVTLVNAKGIGQDGNEFNFFESGNHTFDRKDVRTLGIGEGDGVLVLGFPLGIAGDERNYAIARQGIIARIQDWLNGVVPTFLIDASIFPGNSGGPVVTRPDVGSIVGTQANRKSALIGMVSSYLPYVEVAVSVQTGKPRMTFEENSGLGVVIPNDVIQETVQLAVEAVTKTQR